MDLFDRLYKRKTEKDRLYYACIAVILIIRRSMPCKFKDIILSNSVYKIVVQELANKLSPIMTK